MRVGLRVAVQSLRTICSLLRFTWKCAISMSLRCGDEQREHLQIGLTGAMLVWITESQYVCSRWRLHRAGKHGEPAHKQTVSQARAFRVQVVYVLQHGLNGISQLRHECERRHPRAELCAQQGRPVRLGGEYVYRRSIAGVQPVVGVQEHLARPRVLVAVPGTWRDAASRCLTI